MKSKFRLAGIIGGLIVIIMSFFAMIPIDKKETKEVVTWMSEVDDEKLITELSIPGTHNSGAEHSLFDLSGRCQDLSIESQLNIGVRFLDLRLKLVNDQFKIYHNFIDQKLLLNDVLDTIHSFIKENNQEFLFISIKEEQDPKNSSLGFEEALLRDLDDYKDIISYQTTLPSKVKDARGKIFIVSRYANSTIGVHAYEGWQDSTSFEMREFYVQDNYCIDDTNEKINDIKATIEYSKTNKDKFVINFTSCYIDVPFPPSYAGTAANSVNPWLNEYLDEEKGCLGVMAMDFITVELAKKVYMRNL